jgi:hypothetical protein
VTVAVILLVYAAGVGTAGSRLLGRARWAVRAPLLGIVIYLAAAWSVLAALGLAGLTLAVHATALGGGLGQESKNSHEAHAPPACGRRSSANSSASRHTASNPPA